MDTLSRQLQQLEATIHFIRKTKAFYKSAAKAHSGLGKKYQDAVKKLVCEEVAYDKFLENHRIGMLKYVKLQYDCQEKFIELHDEMKIFNALLIKTWDNLKTRKKHFEEYRRSCCKILGMSNSQNQDARQGPTQEADLIIRDAVDTQNYAIEKEFQEITDRLTENAFLKAKMCMVYQFNAYSGKFCRVDFNIVDLKKELSTYLHRSRRASSYDRYIPSPRALPYLTLENLSPIPHSRPSDTSQNSFKKDLPLVSPLNPSK